MSDNQTPKPKFLARPRFAPAAEKKVIKIHVPPPRIPKPEPEDEDESTYEMVDGTYAGTMARYYNKIKSPITAIRSHCVHCCCGQPSEVEKCTAVKCSLYPFRMGSNPFHGKAKNRMIPPGQKAKQEDGNSDE